MPESDRGLRRVSVHADTARIDLALPATVPVATLIPAIVDIVAAGEARRTKPSVAARYQLSRPGSTALHASTTLAQNAIRDGTVLVLTRSPTGLPAPCFDDEAEAVSATLDAAARPWTRRAARLTGAVAASWLAAIGGLMLIRNSFGTAGAGSIGMAAGLAAIAGCVCLLAAVIAHRAYRDPIAGLTFGLLATGFSAVAGFLAVPGGPGAPNVLLAAMAAAVSSVVGMCIIGCGAVTLTAVSCFAGAIAVTALGGVTTRAPLQVIGSLSAAASLGLLEASTRVSIMLAGLSPRLPSAWDVDAGETEPATDYLATKAIRADDWLTSLAAACSSSAAVGAMSTAVGVHSSGVPRLGGIVFAAVTGVALLLRARSQVDLARMLVLLGSGMATISATLVVAAAASPQHAPWITAGTAVLAGAASCLGFVTPAMTFSPVARRSVELLEYLALAAMVPLTCWICGLYAAARGLHLT